MPAKRLIGGTLGSQVKAQRRIIPDLRAME
jgi:hypothetical protein